MTRLPTEPWKKFLDREFALANARDLIEIARPLLQEVVNYSTAVFQRCLYAGHSSSIDMPAFALFYHAIELTDGVEVLLSQSCCEPAIPLLRSTFEAVLSLKYMFQKDYELRSRTWLYCHFKSRTSFYKVLDSSSDVGKQFKKRFSEEYPGVDLESLDPGGLRLLVEELEAPEYAEIAAEYKKIKKASKRTPQWYRLFCGPQNLRSLAEILNEVSDYDLMYRRWSMVTHACDVSRFRTGDQGKIVGHQLRYPSKLSDYASQAILYLAAAIQSMISRFRPGEYQHQEWVNEVMTENVRLIKFRVVETRLPF
jgi:hypothetical protein